MTRVSAVVLAYGDQPYVLEVVDSLLGSTGVDVDVVVVDNGCTAPDLAPLRDRPGVADVRVLGGIGVVQLDHPVDLAAATAAALDAGVWLRPFRDLVYTMPPYVCAPEDLATITAGVAAAAAAG